MAIVKTLTNILRLLGSVAIAAVCLGVGACTYSSYVNDAALEAIRVGDSVAVVRGRFRSAPSERDAHGTKCGYYTCSPCQGTCYERLWYENRLSLFDEKWFVVLDSDRRVLSKGKISSP